MTKEYRGFRDETGMCHVEVRTKGQALGRPLKHEVRHSPTGYEWGYAGSGPADLARSLLADHLGQVPEPAVYQRFKALVVQNMLKDGWTLTTEDIDRTLANVHADLSKGQP